MKQKLAPRGVYHIPSNPSLVALYCRSRDTQSLIKQIEECKQYAVENGWEIGACFKEIGSGDSLSGREVLTRALTIARVYGARLLVPRFETLCTKDGDLDLLLNLGYEVISMS